MVRHACGLTMLILLLLPRLGFSAWYADPSWENRQKVTISQTVTPAALTDFPYLVKIVDASNPLFAKAQSDGDDLLFTLSDGTTKLDHEIEFYDSISGVLWAWVKFPSLAVGSDTEVYLYYGNASAPDQQNTASVWSNGYAAVYHLHGDFNDSVGAYPGTNTGSFNATGQVADGQEFSPQGGVDYVSLGGWNVSGNQLTIQAWINPDTFAQDDPRVLSKANDPSEQGHVWMLSLFNGSSGENRLRARLKTGASDASGTTTLIATAGPGDLPSAGQWNHAAMTYDGATMRLVRNGADVGSTAKSGNLRQNSWEGMIGNNPNGFLPNQYSWDGKLDEVRISTVARSLNWLTAESRNQGDPESYQSLGPEESVYAELTVLKSVLTVRDPLGAVTPAALAIPGAVVQYEVSVTNSGSAAATENIVTDALNSNLTFLAGEFNGGTADVEIIVGAAPPVYCIAEVGGDTNADGCFLNAAGTDLSVTIPVSGSYPTGLTVGTTAPDNVVVVHFRATVN